MRYVIHSSYHLLITFSACPLVFITSSFFLLSLNPTDGVTFNFLITYFSLLPQNSTCISLITSSFLLQFLVLVTKHISFFLLLLLLLIRLLLIRLLLRLLLRLRLRLLRLRLLRLRLLRLRLLLRRLLLRRLLPLLLLNLASCTYCITLHLRTHTHTLSQDCLDQ